VFERQGGDFYSIHGNDIQIALKTSYKSSIVVKTMAPDELQSLKYASFNKSIFERMVKELLIVIGYKVEVYTSRREDKGEWALEFKGSPGNLSQFEDLLFNNAEPEILSNLLLSLHLESSQQQKVTATEVDMLMMTQHVFTFRNLALLALMPLSTSYQLQKLKILFSTLNLKLLSFSCRRRNASCHLQPEITRKSKKFLNEMESL
jgi:hypothetical protein